MEKQKTIQKIWYEYTIPPEEDSPLIRLSIEEHKKRLQILLPIKKSCFSLNCGCGRGTQDRLFGPSIGIDISFKNVQALKNRGGTGVVADMEFLPFKKGSFDIVYGFGILHHLNNIEKGVLEAVRVLKNKGHIGFGGENNGLCPINYLMPFFYKNWKVEKGFYRIRKNRIKKIFRKNGIREIKIMHGGMTIYGMGKIVYIITNYLEKIFSYIPILKRFSGYLYIAGEKIL
jgi:ubiquinone/menaquinone biosynthesis C-methylase UbiE